MCVSPPLAELSHHEGDESCVPDKIPLPHPARLLIQAPRPLEPCSLHPHRGSGDHTRSHVKGPANAQGKGYTKALEVLGHPVLPPWARHANEEHLRLCSPYRLYHRLAILVLEIAIVHAGNPQSRVRRDGSTRRLFYDSRSRTQKVHRVALLRSQLRESVQQVWTGDPLGQRLAEQSGGPNNGLAISADQSATSDDRAEPNIFAKLKHRVGVDETPLDRPTRLNKPVHLNDSLIESQRIHVAAEKVDPVTAGAASASHGSLHPSTVGLASCWSFLLGPEDTAWRRGKGLGSLTCPRPNRDLHLRQESNAIAEIIDALSRDCRRRLTDGTNSPWWGLATELSFVHTARQTFAAAVSRW